MSSSRDAMDCSPQGYSVHGILQAKKLEWVVISFSRGSPLVNQDQGLNPGLLYCRPILYQLSYKKQCCNIQTPKSQWLQSIYLDFWHTRVQQGVSCVADGSSPSGHLGSLTPIFWPHHIHHSLRNQPWIFIGRNDAEVEAPILWPPDMKSWLLGKDLDAGKDWRREEKRATGWDDWTTSLTQWTWVWANSGR